MTQANTHTAKYLPIEDYALIGDLHTVALVGKNGSIDWCCLPSFDSPSIFAALLDDRKGGSWCLAPAEDSTVKQMYLPNTNVLMTRFFADQGMAEVTDFMPIGREAGGQTEQSARQIVRMARAVRGPVRFRMTCRPAFDYARAVHEIRLEDDGRTAVFASPQQQFVIKSSHAMEPDANGAVAEFILESGDQAVFVLRHQRGRADESLGREPIDGEALL